MLITSFYQVNVSRIDTVNNFVYLPFNQFPMWANGRQSMNKNELEAFAKQAAKGIKTEVDLNEFRAMLIIVGQCE